MENINIKKYNKIKQKIINFNNWKDFKCHYCSKQLTFDQINLDHILPIGLLTQLGINLTRKSCYHHHQWNNMQITCRRCNSLKANKIDWYHPKTKELLNFFILEAQKELDLNIFNMQEEIDDLSTIS